MALHRASTSFPLARPPWLSLASVALASLLTACTAAHQPMGMPIQPPHLADASLLAVDGARLPLRTWAAQGEPKAVVVALHGMNDYSGAFEQPATWWAEHGITTYAFDQRGFGASSQPGVWADTATLTADLSAAVDAVGARHPALPVFVLGESMGGAVAVAALASAAGAPPVAPSRLAGVILSAPALWGRQTMNPFFRFTLWAGYHTIPGKTLTPPRGLRIVASDNLEMLRALGRDPLVLKRTRLDALHGLVDLMSDAYEGLDHLPTRLPVLVMYGQNEQVLNRNAVTETVTRTARGALGDGARLAVYEDGYHLLLRDSCAQRVWRDVLAWMHDPKAPLPSGADAATWASQVPPLPDRLPACAPDSAGAPTPGIS